MNFLFYIYILSFVFLSLKMYKYLFDFTKKTSIWEFLEYVANVCGSWFLVKSAPLGASYMKKLYTALHFSTFGIESPKWSVMDTST